MLPKAISGDQRRQNAQVRSQEISWRNTVLPLCRLHEFAGLQVTPVDSKAITAIASCLSQSPRASTSAILGQRRGYASAPRHRAR